MKFNLIYEIGLLHNLFFILIPKTSYYFHYRFVDMTDIP